MKPTPGNITKIAIILYLLFMLALLVFATSCTVQRGVSCDMNWKSKNMNIDTIYCDGDKIHITLSK